MTDLETKVTLDKDALVAHVNSVVNTHVTTILTTANEEKAKAESFLQEFEALMKKWFAWL